MFSLLSFLSLSEGGEPFFKGELFFGQEEGRFYGGRVYF